MPGCQLQKNCCKHLFEAFTIMFLIRVTKSLAALIKAVFLSNFMAYWLHVQFPYLDILACAYTVKPLFERHLYLSGTSNTTALWGKC